MPAASVYEEILDAVKVAIDALSLSGISSVVIEDMPSRTDRTLPYVSVAPSPISETIPDGTNIRDDVEYRVQVAIVASKSATTMATVLGWRQSIRRRMSEQKLQAAEFTGGTFKTLQCTPQVPLDPAALTAHKAYLSVLLVRVTVREART